MSYPQHDQSQPTFTPHDPGAPAGPADETIIRPMPVYTEPERPAWAKDPRNLVDNGFEEPYYRNPDAPQPNGRPRLTPGQPGYQAQEDVRGLAASSKKGSIKNFLSTGDAKMSRDSREGQALGERVHDAYAWVGFWTAVFGFGVLGLIFSILSIKDARAAHRATSGFAVAGLIISIAEFVLAFVIIAILIITTVLFASAVNSYTYPTYGG